MENFSINSGHFGPWTSNVSAEDFGLANRANRLLASKETATEIYKEIFADPWDPINNPQGKINLCTAENNLCEDLLNEKILSTPEIFVPPLDYLYHYPSPGGYEHTKYAIVKYLQKFISRPGDPPLNIDNFILVPGCTAAYDMLGFCLFDARDVVLCPSPFYSRLYDNFQERAQVEIRGVPFEDLKNSKLHVFQFQDAIEAIKSEGKSPKAISLVIPHNPLGIVFAEEEILNLCQWVAKNDLHLIVDEVFFSTIDSEIDPRKSLLSFRYKFDSLRQRLVWMWSVSKDLCLPGVRFAVIHTENEGLLKALRRLEIMQPCPPIVQHFVTCILGDHDWIKNFHIEKNRRLHENRLLAMTKLKEIQVPYVYANSGLFIFLDLRQYISEPTFEAERFLWTRMCYSRIYLNPGQHMGTTEPGWFRLVISKRKDALEEGLNRLARLIAYLPRRELVLSPIPPIDIPISITTRQTDSRLSKESGFESGPSSDLPSSTSPESTRSFVKIRQMAQNANEKTLDEKLAIIAGQRKSDTLSSVASRESYSSGKSDDTIINLVFGSSETSSVETTIFRPDGSVESSGMYRIKHRDENLKPLHQHQPYTPDIIEEPLKYDQDDAIAEAHGLIDLIDEYYVEETDTSHSGTKNTSASVSQDSVVRLCGSENQRYRKFITAEGPIGESTLKRRKPVRHKENVTKKQRPSSAEEGYGELKEIMPLLREKQISEDNILDEDENDRSFLNVDIRKNVADDSGIDLKPPSTMVSPRNDAEFKQEIKNFDVLAEKWKTNFKNDGSIESQRIKNVSNNQNSDINRIIAIESSKKPSSHFTEEELWAIINRVGKNDTKTVDFEPRTTAVYHETVNFEPRTQTKLRKIQEEQEKPEEPITIPTIQRKFQPTFTEEELLAIINRPREIHRKHEIESLDTKRISELVYNKPDLIPLEEHGYRNEKNYEKIEKYDLENEVQPKISHELFETPTEKHLFSRDSILELIAEKPVEEKRFESYEKTSKILIPKETEQIPKKEVESPQEKFIRSQIYTSDEILKLINKKPSSDEEDWLESERLISSRSSSSSSSSESNVETKHQHVHSPAQDLKRTDELQPDFFSRDYLEALLAKSDVEGRKEFLEENVLRRKTADTQSFDEENRWEDNEFSKNLALQRQPDVLTSFQAPVHDLKKIESIQPTIFSKEYLEELITLRENTEASNEFVLERKPENIQNLHTTHVSETKIHHADVEDRLNFNENVLQRKHYNIAEKISTPHLHLTIEDDAPVYKFKKTDELEPMIFSREYIEELITRSEIVGQNDGEKKEYAQHENLHTLETTEPTTAYKNSHIEPKSVESTKKLDKTYEFERLPSTTTVYTQEEILELFIRKHSEKSENVSNIDELRKHVFEPQTSENTVFEHEIKNIAFPTNDNSEKGVELQKKEDPKITPWEPKVSSTSELFSREEIEQILNVASEHEDPGNKKLSQENEQSIEKLREPMPEAHQTVEKPFESNIPPRRTSFDHILLDVVFEALDKKHLQSSDTFITIPTTNENAVSSSIPTAKREKTYEIVESSPLSTKKRFGISVDEAEIRSSPSSTCSSISADESDHKTHPSGHLFREEEFSQFIEETHRKLLNERKLPKKHASPLLLQKKETNPEKIKIHKKRVVKHAKKKSDTSEDDEYIACKCSKEARPPRSVFSEEELVALVSNDDEQAKKIVESIEKNDENLHKDEKIETKTQDLRPIEVYQRLESTSSTKISSPEPEPIPTKMVYPQPIEPTIIIKEKPDLQEYVQEKWDHPIVHEKHDGFPKHDVSNVIEEEDTPPVTKSSKTQSIAKGVEDRENKAEDSIPLDIIFASIDVKIAEEKDFQHLHREKSYISPGVKRHAYKNHDIPMVVVSKPMEPTPDSSEEEKSRFSISGSSTSSSSSKDLESTKPVTPTPSLTSFGKEEKTILAHKKNEDDIPIEIIFASLDEKIKADSINKLAEKSPERAIIISESATVVDEKIEYSQISSQHHEPEVFEHQPSSDTFESKLLFTEEELLKLIREPEISYQHQKIDTLPNEIDLKNEGYDKFSDQLPEIFARKHSSEKIQRKITPSHPYDGDITKMLKLLAMKKHEKVEIPDKKEIFEDVDRVHERQRPESKHDSEPKNDQLNEKIRYEKAEETISYSVYTREDIERLLAEEILLEKTKNDDSEHSFQDIHRRISNSNIISKFSIQSISEPVVGKGHSFNPEHDKNHLPLPELDKPYVHGSWNSRSVFIHQELTPLYSKEELEALLALEKPMESPTGNHSHYESEILENREIEQTFDQKNPEVYAPSKVYLNEERSFEKYYEPINLDLVFSVVRPKSQISYDEPTSPSSSIVNMNGYREYSDRRKSGSSPVSSPIRAKSPISSHSIRVRSPIHEHRQDVGLIRTTYGDPVFIDFDPTLYKKPQISYTREPETEPGTKIGLNYQPLERKNEKEEYAEHGARIHQQHTEIKITSRPRKSSDDSEKHVVIEHVNITEVVYEKDDFDRKKTKNLDHKLKNQEKSMLHYFPMNKGPRYYVVEKFNPSDRFDLHPIHSNEIYDSFTEKVDTSVPPTYELILGLNDAKHVISKDVAIQTPSPIDLCCRLKLISKKSNMKKSNFVPESVFDAEKHSQEEEFLVCRNPGHTESGHHCCSKRLYKIKSSTMDTKNRDTTISTPFARRYSNSSRNSRKSSSTSSSSSSNSIDRISVRHSPVSTSWLVSSVYKSTPQGYEKIDQPTGFPITILPDVVRIDIRKEA